MTDVPRLGGPSMAATAQDGLDQSPDKWIAERFWQEDDNFYEDETPEADGKTLKAVDDLGNPLY
ncbi:hypothetical protein FSY75_21410 [Streptomyces sp. TR1341]|uniref:hypothetical protein n=1 Tax=Streptomyces sp. TR1341 TaxID=2601266 RepID=UPI00138AB949|nr:hypothetical protein [Streptomyces sp. TR1341]